MWNGSTRRLSRSFYPNFLPMEMPSVRRAGVGACRVPHSGLSPRVPDSRILTVSTFDGVSRPASTSSCAAARPTPRARSLPAAALFREQRRGRVRPSDRTRAAADDRHTPG